MKVSTALLLLFTNFESFAQIETNIASSYTKAYPAKQFTLKSSSNKNREYKIHVHYVMDSLVEGKTYPVLYYTDAWFTVDLFNIMGHLLFKRKEIEPVILVGISFDANDETWQKLRNEDFLPNLSNPDSLNGANYFLSFIKNDLIPFIEKNYPADKKDRGLFGYSSGGAFATWVLKEEPNLFKRIGIASAPLSHQDFLLLKDPILLSNIKQAASKKMFISYGSLESEKTKIASNKLFELLKENKIIVVERFVFENETHGSSFPSSCTKALSFLYGK